MQADLAAAPEARKPHLLARALPRLTLPAVVFLTLALELLLAERKFAIFAGGFGQSRAIDTWGETGAFLGALLASQALALYILYRLVRRMHGRRADTPLFHLNFFYWASFVIAAGLIAKYQALAYFSDALSFQVIRNLGGGSLFEAASYVLSEGALIGFVGLGALVAYVALLLLLRRRWRGAAPWPDRTRLAPRQLAVALLLTPLLLYGASRIEDVRAALVRFNAPYALTLLLDGATDVDRDGYGLFGWPADTQPFDGSRHPFALDVPNNGIDEDGYAGDLVLAEPAPRAPAPVTIAGERPHVVLIVLESTRGDLLGRRFAGRPVAPTLDALAATGTSVPAAYSHAGFTTLSLRTLFTGRLAAHDPAGSLFEVFRANGYRTGVFSGQAEDFGGIAETVGMRSADVYVDAARLRDERVYSLGSDSSLAIDGRTLLREFDRHFGGTEAWARPNFLYFNLQSAHFPYSYPSMDRILTDDPLPRGEIAPANRARLEATYWNAQAYNDRLVAAVIGRLRRLGVWEHTLLIVTADHGESLFDDGFLGHGHMINAQQNRIPFIMNRQMAVAGPVGLQDMRGIILRAAGAADVPAARGATPGRVFQYIGSLDRPSSVGTVDARGRYAIFSFDREALWTSASPAWRAYRSLGPGSAERAEADALIREWGRQRWLNRAGG